MQYGTFIKQAIYLYRNIAQSTVEAQNLVATNLTVFVLNINLELSLLNVRTQYYGNVI